MRGYRGWHVYSHVKIFLNEHASLSQCHYLQFKRNLAV